MSTGTREYSAENASAVGIGVPGSASRDAPLSSGSGHGTISDKEIEYGDDERDVKRKQARLGTCASFQYRSLTSTMLGFPWQIPLLARVPIHWCHLWRYRDQSPLRLFIHVQLRA